jgi:hypothetical protein
MEEEFPPARTFLVGLALFSSTCLGMYAAFTYLAG